VSLISTGYARISGSMSFFSGAVQPREYALLQLFRR
jgi:hypothetical protein